ncbi:MAG: ABC transporter permease subunit [Candidatus Sumerlaeia bacterium]|nr:ABC transporter permease subunit [Candidatus Sumerlaeia bacterium]
MNAILLIGKGVVLETLRRQEFHLVVIIAGLLMLKAIVVRMIGIENPATGTLLLNLSMTVATWTALIFTLLTVSGLVPKELENRTVYLLLARPVTRAQFFLGKWGAGIALGVVAYLMLLALAWAPGPRMEANDGAMMAQTVIFGIGSIIMIATLAITLSLLLPQPVTIVLVGLMAAGGEMAANLFRTAFRSDAVGSLLEWGANYLPAFGRLNTVTRYTDGIGPLGFGDFMALLAHVLIISGVTLVGGIVLFEKRSI